MHGQRRVPDGGVVDLHPGNYHKQTEVIPPKNAGDDPKSVVVWWVRPPKGGVQRVAAESVTEHKDGTITVSHELTNEDGSWTLAAGVWQVPGSPAEEKSEGRGRRTAKAH